MEEINRYNCRFLLIAFLNKNSLTTKKIAKALRCSESSLSRILADVTYPSDEMLKQVGILLVLGFTAYSKLSMAEREKISEAAGTAVGGGVGFVAITYGIAGVGSVAGVSAAGITSGLAALGSTVGGGMLIGVSIAAILPIAAGAAGFGAIKGVKYLISEKQLRADTFDSRWEQAKE